MHEDPATSYLEHGDTLALFGHVEGIRLYMEPLSDLIITIIGYKFDPVRKELQSQGVLIYRGDHLEFAQDYLFNSPSLAAGVVQGRSANGRIDWKDNYGRTLKEIQEEKMGIQPNN